MKITQISDLPIIDAIENLGTGIKGIQRVRGMEFL
jgi:hypothetical protein